MANFDVVPNYLTALQGPVSVGKTRETLLSLLQMAISSGKQTTALKILAKDPSLIRDQFLDCGKPVSVLASALQGGMSALVPFALMRGIDVETCVNGKGLLEHAVLRGSAALASQALAFGASPHAQPPQTSDNRQAACDDSLLFVDIAVNHLVMALGNGKQPLVANEAADLVLMLLDAGASPAGSKTTSALPRLCTLDWALWPQQQGRLAQLLQELIKRGGDVNMKVGGMPLLRLAAGAKNIPAVLGLLKAGADTSLEFLGTDLISSLSKNGLSEHIPAISEFVMRNQIERARKAAAKEGAEQRPSAVETVTTEIDGSTPAARRYENFDVL